MSGRFDNTIRLIDPHRNYVVKRSTHISKCTTQSKIEVPNYVDKVVLSEVVAPEVVVYNSNNKADLHIWDCKIGQLTVIGGITAIDVVGCEIGTYVINQSSNCKVNAEFPKCERSIIWVLDVTKCIGVEYKLLSEKECVKQVLTKYGLMTSSKYYFTHR